jgi:hypothetical protein
MLGSADGPSSLVPSMSMVVEQLKNQIDAVDAHNVC